MTLAWIAAALLAGLVVKLLLGSKAKAAPARSRNASAVSQAAGTGVAAVAAGPTESVPVELQAFSMIRADDLPLPRQQALAQSFKDVPRPPRLLQQLVSPAFLADASSAQLVDLIAAEPLIAAQVLAAVNSPVYGLQHPVASIGQAVTYLGLNTVRAICLRYLLIASFKADSPERARILDAIWASSAIAGDLAGQLAQRLGMGDHGAIVSAVLLSFLGRLAIAATGSQDSLVAQAEPDALARAAAEQARLGLCAAELGRLLMREWGLPDSIVADAADIEAVMLKPNSAFDAERAARLGLSHFCVRWSERLVNADPGDDPTFDPRAEAGAELFHLRGYLRLPQLSRLAEFSQAPTLMASIQKQHAALAGRGA